MVVPSTSTGYDEAHSRRSLDTRRTTAIDCPATAAIQPPSSFVFMSLNQRGKIVAQVLHARVATSDRGKSKRSPTARPRPPVPPQDIIEISSDEDENLTLQPKRPFVNHDSQLSEKQEIEKLKKVVYHL